MIFLLEIGKIVIEKRLGIDWLVGQPYDICAHARAPTHTSERVHVYYKVQRIILLTESLLIVKILLKY